MSAPPAIHFFATKDDLRRVFEAVESAWRLQYVEAGMFDSPTIHSIPSGSEIPNLGLAPSGTYNGEPFWLITRADKSVEVETVPQRGGGVRYCVDNRRNPDSILLWPGGLYDHGCLIAGRFGTGLRNPAVDELMRVFRTPISKTFAKVKSYLLGPEALGMFNSGCRLTGNAKSPRNLDLSRD